MAIRNAISVRLLILLLSILGILVAATLLSKEQPVSILAKFPLCGSSNSACATVMKSKWSVFPPGALDEPSLPISDRFPTSLLGLIHFLFLFGWFLFIGNPTPDRSLWFLIPFLEVTVACVFAGMLAGVLVSLKMWCPLCIATHVITGMLALCIGASWSRIGVRPQGGTGHPTLSLGICALALNGSLAVVVWEVWDNAVLRANQIGEGGGDTDDVGPALARHFGREAKNVFVDPGDPIIPADSQKYSTLVVFWDLQCPACQAFSEKLHNSILPLFQGRLRLVLKYFPLAKECNAVSGDIHPHACEVAYLIEAARIQGRMPAFRRFEFMLQAVYGTPDRELLEFMAKQAGLNVDQVARDQESLQVRDRVRQHVEQGIELGVSGTPTVFFDGRPVDPTVLNKSQFWKALADRVLQGETQ